MTGQEQQHQKKPRGSRKKTPALKLPPVKKCPVSRKKKCPVSRKKTSPSKSKEATSASSPASTRMSTRRDRTTARSGNRPQYGGVNEVLQHASKTFNVPIRLVRAIYAKETTSGTHIPPPRSKARIEKGSHVSSAGAIGPMQIMPATFRRNGAAVRSLFSGEKPDIWNPKHSAAAGVAELARLYKKYGPEGAARGYLGGEGGLRSGGGYARAVMKHYRKPN